MSRRVCSLVAALCLAASVGHHVGLAQASIAFIQMAYATPQSPQTSVSATYAQAQTAGNLNVLLIGWNDTTAQIATVTDSRGNSYLKAIGPTVRAGALSQSIYYSANIVAANAAANTVTVTFTVPAQYVDLRIAEYRGIDRVNPVDVVVGASGSGSPSNSGSVTTTNANDLLVSANMVTWSTSGPGTGYTNRVITVPDSDMLADRVVTAVGSYNATATLAGGEWVHQLVAFRAAAVSSDTQPPTAPASLTATAVSSAQVNLVWTASTDNVGVTGYRIERCTGASCTTFAQIGTSTTPTFADTTTAGNTSYNYRVRANDAAGNLSGYSNTAGATTPQTPDTQAPTAPGGLTATPVSTSQINLTWTASTDNVGVTNYLIERCQGSGCTTFSQIATSATTAFNDTGRSASTLYRYRVRATDAANNLSAYSAIASATTPAAADTQAPTAPTNLALAVNSDSQITLTWTASTDNVGVTSYSIERCQGAGCSSFAEIGTSATATNVSSGLVGSTSYSYRVRARDAAANFSGYSLVASATTSATPATPAIAFVQVNAACPQSSVANVSVPYTQAQTAGNLNVVVVGWNSPTGAVQSVTDTRGNTYLRAVGPTVGPGFATQSIYYAANIVAGSTNTVTVTFDSAVPFPDIRVAEYRGIAPLNPVDVVAAAQGNGALADSGAVTTTNPTDLLVGANMVLSYTSGPGASFTSRIITNPDADILEDRIVTSAGSYNATAPLGSAPWIMQMVAFKAGAAAPDTQAPTAPTNLAATPVSETQINLTWGAATDNVGVTGYKVERCQGTGCSTFSEIAALSGTTTTFGDTGLTANTAYGYRVRAVDAATNTSAYSNTVNVSTLAPDTEPPSAPGLLVATTVSGSQIDVSWGAATDNVGVAGYRLERCQGVGCTIFNKIGTTITGTSFSDTGLSVDTSYSYVVRAQDAPGNLGPLSNVGTARTLATNPNLVAAYSFDEGNGSSVLDMSGHANNGTAANTTWSTTGKFGKALSFNGTNAMVTIPDSSSLHLTTAMTLEVWVNPSGPNLGWKDVIYKGNDNYYLMGATPSGPPAIGMIVGSTNTEAFGPSTLPLNTWTFLAATYDGTTLRLYVNGTQVASQPRTGPIITSTNPLQIGGDSIYGQFYQGMIDEVRVYSVALSPAQILADMASAVGGSSLSLGLNPASLTFGNQAVGTSSLPSTVTLTNQGSAALSIASITVSGGQAADYGQTNNCVGTIAASASCTINVTFTPTNSGLRNASIVIADNAPGNPHSVALTGTGVGFTLTPRTTVLTPAQTQQFTPGDTGGSAVLWAVDGITGGNATVGLVSATGLYVPPNARGTHLVTVSTTDGTKTATATVYVTNSAGMYTHHNDNARTGQNLQESVLTTSTVNAATFGKLNSYAIDGIAHASPLYVANVNVPGIGLRNIVYVATEHDSVYAFDADGTGTTPLWKVSFLSGGVTTVPDDDVNEFFDITPEIGITGTPVIDPSTSTLYVVAKTKEGSTTYRQRLHALDLGTGGEKFGGPVLLQATVPGFGNGSTGGQLAFDSLRENQRTALLLHNGVIYMGFGSHGDNQPYHGWLLGYNATTLQRVMAWVSTPNGEGGGIWQSGGGLAIDNVGNFFFATGDGSFSLDTGGTDYGNTFLKFNPSTGVIDYFTPHDQAILDQNNLDLDAGGMLLLPDQPGAHPHLLVSAGKDGTIYLVDRDNMGHYNASANQNVQTLPNIFPFGTPLPGNYSSPVYFNGTVYFGPVADVAQAFKLTNGLLSTSPTSTTPQAFSYPGATLAVSANGTNNGIIWAVQKNDAAPGTLRAYDASNLAIELYNSEQSGTRDAFDAAAKFSVPLVINGKVFVASEGRLTVFGLLPQ